jgi:hypothetical protein
MGDISQGHPGLIRAEFQFKAICIKRFCQPPMWPLLRPLVTYDFYKDENGMLGVDCDCHEKKWQNNHVLFWINTKSYNETINFDEYFIKIEETK